MFLKLLKYELTFYTKTLFLVEAFLLVFGGIYFAFWGVLNYVFIEQHLVLESELVSAIYEMIVYSINPLLLSFQIGVLLLSSVIVIFYRTYKHYHSKEGYLTHTLPISSAKHLSVSILSGFFAQLSAVIVMFVLFSLVFGGYLLSDIDVNTLDFFAILAVMIALLALPLVIVYFSVPLYSHFSACLSHVICPRYKMWGSIGFFTAQIIIAGGWAQLTLPTYMIVFSLLNNSFLTAHSYYIFSLGLIILTIGILAFFPAVLMVVSIVLYFVTRRLMTHHLNFD